MPRDNIAGLWKVPDDIRTAVWSLRKAADLDAKASNQKSASRQWQLLASLSRHVLCPNVLPARGLAAQAQALLENATAVDMQDEIDR